MDEKTVKEKLVSIMEAEMREINRVFGPYVRAGFSLPPVAYESIVIRFDEDEGNVGAYRIEIEVNENNSPNEILFQSIMGLKKAHKEWNARIIQIDNILNSFGD